MDVHGIKKQHLQLQKIHLITSPNPLHFPPFFNRLVIPDDIHFLELASNIPPGKLQRNIVVKGSQVTHPFHSPHPQPNEMEP